MGAFNGLTKLTALAMWDNEISEIKRGTFDNMNRLQRLSLYHNGIEQLKDGAFSGLNNLKHIDLGRNKLQYVHPDTFAGLQNLEWLELNYNPNLQIPTDRYFISSHSLSRLSISDCSVRSVSAETFANVTALEWLHLSYNNLRSVDINMLKVLPKLSALHLYGNPLQCDCQLQEVWRWSQHHNIRTEYEFTAPKCATPSEVQGMWWGVLEKSQCLQDNIKYYGDFKDTSYIYTPTGNGGPTPYISDFLLHCLLLPIAVFFTFGVTGNVILIMIITCNKDMRTVPNMYILNLAISDLLVLTLIFSLGFKLAMHLTVTNFIIIFVVFLSRLSVGLSAYSVAVLSIQRYRVTVNPLHVRASSQPTWRATGATICGVWIVAALFALPSGVWVHLCNVSSEGTCLTHGQRVVLFELLVFCVIPLCVIAVSYIITARQIFKSAQPISEETQSPQLNTRTNTAKIVLALTAVYLISYVPYHVLLIFLLWTDHSLEHSYFTHFKTFIILTYLLLISPCLNPVALFCTGRAFRRQFKRYLTCCCKANPTAADVELTRRN
jgi:hypothetical protein